MQQFIHYNILKSPAAIWPVHQLKDRSGKVSPACLFARYSFWVWIL